MDTSGVGSKQVVLSIKGIQAAPNSKSTSDRKLWTFDDCGSESSMVSRIDGIHILKA